MTTYEQLHTLASPILKAYRDDLENYDRQRIDAHPALPFLHWTRESGTHMAMMPPADDSEWPKRGEYVKFLFDMVEREHILKSIVQMAEHFVNPCYGNAKLVLWFDGSRFHKIGANAALEIAQQYQRRILGIWNRKPIPYVPRFESQREVMVLA